MSAHLGSLFNRKRRALRGYVRSDAGLSGDPAVGLRCRTRWRRPSAG